MFSLCSEDERGFRLSKRATSRITMICWPAAWRHCWVARLFITTQCVWTRVRPSSSPTINLLDVQCMTGTSSAWMVRHESFAAQVTNINSKYTLIEHSISPSTASKHKERSGGTDARTGNEDRQTQERKATSSTTCVHLNLCITSPTTTTGYLLHPSLPGHRPVAASQTQAPSPFSPY